MQDIYSKEKPSLALFISTSNEHILDKTMVKILGLIIYEDEDEDVSPVANLLTCSLF